METISSNSAPPRNKDRWLQCLLISLFLAVLFGVLQVMVYRDLAALERGEVQSVRVWAPIAWAYETLGFQGAVWVLPGMWIFVTVAQIYNAWKIGPTGDSTRVQAIERKEFEIGRLITVIACSLFGGALFLLGAGLTLIVLISYMAQDRRGESPLFLVFVGIGLAVIGGLFLLLAWHNRRR